MKARKSFGEDYECKQFWPSDCFVQCGDMGLVLEKSIGEVFDSEDPLKEVIENVSYTTAFFEAFPQNPKTFIRGEGKTIEEAEAKAFEKFEKYSACDHSSFEKRGYKNGYGFCTQCGMGKSQAFEPEYKCEVCGKPTYYGFDQDNNPYCEEHWEDVPDEKRPKLLRRKLEED